MRELCPSIRGGLVASAAALVVGILFGSAAPAQAQNGGALHACVNVDRWGNYSGDLHLVGPNQRCARRQVRITVPLMGAGGISGPPGPQGPPGPAGPQGPPGPAGSGESYEGGGIKGVLTECNEARADSMAYLNGHSFIVFIGADKAHQATGAFEMHHVPPGAYDLTLVTPNMVRIIEDLEVIAGQVNDLGNVSLCPVD